MACAPVGLTLYMLPDEVELIVMQPHVVPIVSNGLSVDVPQARLLMFCDQSFDY